MGNFLPPFSLTASPSSSASSSATTLPHKLGPNLTTLSTLSSLPLGLRLLNFGLVLHSPQITLYRSAFLGTRGLMLLQKQLPLLQLPFPRHIFYLGALGYRSHIPWIGGFALAEHEQQARFGHTFHHSFDPHHPTYLDGINPYMAIPLEKTKYLCSKGRKLFLPPGGEKWAKGDTQNFLRVLEHILQLAQQREPILFHCFAGMHRTGMIALAIRYLQGGHWTHGPKLPIILQGKSWHLNLAQMEYLIHGRPFFRPENFQFIETLSTQEPSFKLLQQRYQSVLSSSIESSP